MVSFIVHGQVHFPKAKQTIHSSTTVFVSGWLSSLLGIGRA